jgi:hypothetical protein
VGKPLALGSQGLTNPPDGDLANLVAAGTFTGPGVGLAVQMYGAFNVAFWAQDMTALTIASGVNAGTVVSAAGLAAGTAVNTVLGPPGLTIATVAGLNVTFNFPTIALEAQYLAGNDLITNLPFTNGLLGASVTGPGWPAGTVVTAIVQPFIDQVQLGSVRTSLAPTQDSTPFGGFNASFSNRSTGRDRILFGLTANSLVTGTDAAAIFTGSGITYAGNIQLEYSMDGGHTWLLANVGGSGQLATYSTGTPVRFVAGEPEQGAAYRLNCTALSSGTVPWRISTTGQAAVSLSIPSGV